MARMNITVPEAMQAKLNRLGTEYDGIVQKMLVEGAKPLEEQVIANLESVVGRDTKFESRSTGALVKAVKVTKAYQVSNGDWHIKVAIYGYDEKGVPNALKGMVLEKGKSGQPAKPWLKPAVSKTKNQCVDAMHTVLDREVSQL